MEINNPSSGLNSTEVHARERVLIDPIDEYPDVLAPNSTKSNAIQGHMSMGNHPIERNDGQLSPNFISQVAVGEPPSNPNFDNLASIQDKTLPLNSTTSNTSSVPVHSVNSLANLTGNFEPS